MNIRTLVGAVAWHTRGVFAVEPLRNVGFAMRTWFQPDEVRARKQLGRELLADAPAHAALGDRVGYVRLDRGLDLHAVCAAGSAISRADAGVIEGGKDFFRRRFSTDAELELLLRAALDRRVLASVTEYLGELPVICDADYYCSVPLGPPWHKSQLWHCDDDGARIVKFFIYCEDVTSANGPFEFIDATRSARARDGVGYRYAGRRYRVADDAMDKYVPREHQLAMQGERTTAFLIDTVHCFHRGSRIFDKTKRRVCAIVCFVQANSRKLPLRLAHGAPLTRFAKRFPDRFQQAALGVPVA